MEITRVQDGSKVTITLEGRLDTKTAPRLEEEVNNLEGVENLVLDFEKLSYVSSAGFRVLLIAQKIMNRQGSMVLRNVCPDIMDVLELTGFSEIIKVEA